MAGVTVKADLTPTAEILEALPEAMEQALVEIGAHLVRSVDARFTAQVDPEGQPWQPVSPQRAKQKKNPKILTESTRLRDSVVDKPGKSQVEVGTNVVYAALHQFGGPVTIQEHTRKLYYRHNADGSLGNTWVKKRKATFEQEATAYARSFKMPARPFLGLSVDDGQEIQEIIQDHIRRTLGG